MSFLLFAHRGANRQAPENTIAAFRLALEAGCDGCECDVQLTRDGRLVVFHDEILTRMTGLSRRVPELTAHQLAALRMSGPGNHPSLETNVPLLQAVWQLHGQRQKLLLAELKYFSEAYTPRETLGEAVLAFAERHAVTERFYAISFDEPLLQMLKERRPSLRTGYIVSDPQRFAKHQQACAQWADVVLPHVECVTPALVAWATAAQRPLYPWVADDETAMTRLASLGVQGLLSNEPARLVAWAKQRSSSPSLG